MSGRAPKLPTLPTVRDADERESRLALALSATPFGIWDWNLVDGDLDLSDRARAMLGLDREGPVSIEMVRETIHPDDRFRIEQLIGRALDPDNRDNQALEYRIMRPDGQTRWVVVHGTSLFGEHDGKVRALRYVGTVQDVSEAVQVEQALRTSEERLRLALDAARLAVWELDLQSERLVTPSPELRRLLDLPESGDLDFGAIKARLAPGERERLKAMSQEHFLRGEEFIDSSMRYLGRGRDERHLVLRARVHYDPHGRPLRAVGVLLDETGQMRAQAALRRSEELRQRAQQAGGIGDWLLDLAADRLTWSDQFAHLLGRTPADMPVAPAGLIRFIHPQDWPRLSRHLAALRSGQLDKLDVEHRVVLPDGTARWLASRAEAGCNEAGRVTQIAGVSFDITPRHEAEQAMRRINETLEAEVEKRTRQLEEASRKLVEETVERHRMEQVLHQSQKMEAIGQLTGGVAHDFNNLLMAVMSNLDLLRKHLPSDPRAERYLEGAITGARRGAALTQRLLAFARRQDLRVEPVDLIALLSGMDDLFDKSVGPEIETRVELPTTLPPALADANQVELALLNLVVNARDAMPEGGVLTIGLDHKRIDQADDLAAGAYACLSVADTGSGMDEGVLRRAMEPFFSTKEVGRGTGLGLPMVHGLAEQLGGAVRLISAPGEGTRAELWLPLASVPDGSPATIVEAHAVAGTRPATILYVDDDPLVAMGTVDMLEDLGHQVIAASSGQEALQILRRSEAIDLLITDHAMPGMTGTQLAMEARALRPDLPILLATGYAEIPDEPGLALPMLSKPYLQDQIAAEIDKLLNA